MAVDSNIVAGRPGNFRWFDKTLAGSAFPMVEGFYEFARSQGITSVASFLENEEQELLPDLGKYYGNLPVFHFPTPNLGVPKENEVFKQFVNLVDEHEKRGDKMLIHCLQGRGRTSLFAGAWLLASGKTMVETMGILKDISGNSDKDSPLLKKFPNYVETEPQERKLRTLSHVFSNESVREAILSDVQTRRLYAFARSLRVTDKLNEPTSPVKRTRIKR